MKPSRSKVEKQIFYAASYGAGIKTLMKATGISKRRVKKHLQKMGYWRC